jgi:hypothetical protein
MKLTKAELERRLHNSSRDNCINWEGAAIRTGDNVLLQPDGESCALIGQLIDLQDEHLVPQGEIRPQHAIKTPQRMALVRWFSTVDEKEAQRPPVGKRYHLPYGMKEVCQTNSAEWVACSIVVNICFIFHLEAIQKGLVSCGGMNRVFYIGFQKLSGDLLPLKERDFHPFYRDPRFPFHEGYPEAMWSQLTSLKL